MSWHRSLSSLSPAHNLWSLLVGLVLLGTALLAANAYFLLRVSGSPLNNLCLTAISSYEQEGAVQLHILINALQRALGMELRIIGPDGRDVIDGTDQRMALSSSNDPAIGTLIRRGQLTTRSGSFTCLAKAQAARPLPGVPPDLLFLPFLSLVCFSIAIYVTLRLRKIEAAITRFGSGLMTTRIGTHSDDPMGRVARAFNLMAERIEYLVEGNRRLCMDIAHELRSPLARLRLAAGLARTHTPRAVDRMEMEIERLNDLVNALLDTAKAEADPGNLQMEALSLGLLLEDILDDCEIEAASRGCVLDLETEPNDIVVANTDLLRRAIENVLRNAIRHNPVGGSIKVRATSLNDTVWVTVRDFGRGVPETELENIFEPFFRVEPDRNRETGGAGLGLAIARRAIKLHQGSVTAENAEPGLIVRIGLPRALSRQEPTPNILQARIAL